MTPSLDQLGVSQLDSAQRLELIGLIWDSIPDSQLVALPEWHLQELARRVAEADANPNAAVPWETVRARLLGEP